MSRIRLLIMVILSSSTTNSVMINIDVTCPPNWIQHPSYKNICYRVGTTAGNFTSATAECEAFLNGSTVVNVYNLEIHNFLADRLLSVGHEYYTGLTDVNGEYVFTQLNNEPLGPWDRWGSVTGGTCTVYANEGGEWVWHTNTCDQLCHYICEYIVPTPGKLPTVLIPVDATPMSGRVEIFWNYMWGPLRDSEFPNTVAIICNDLGHSASGGVECLGTASCGTGKIWYERVDCNGVYANLSECLADGAKLSTQTDHSKNTIVTCGDPLSTYQPTTDEFTTTAEATTETTTAEHTTAEDTTAEETTTPQNVVTTDPITPQNNFTVIYNVTTTVNITVTEIITINITATVTYTSSPVCSYWSSSDVTSSSFPTTNEDPTTTTITSTPPRQELIINEDPQPVIKAKDSAKYSTKTRQDHRPSAQAIGSFGVVIIVVILGAIVAIDVGTIGKEVQRWNRKKSAAGSKTRAKSSNISIRSTSARSFNTNGSSNNLARESAS